MSDVYNYITEDGVIVPDAAVIQEQVTQEYIDQFGSDLVVDSTTPTAQAILINLESLARISVAENNTQLANQFNPNQSGGVYLDALMALLGSYSLSGQPTTVLNVVVSGQPGTVIAAGSQVQNTQNEAIFYNVDQLIIPDSGTITNAVFKCTVNGAITCNPGTLTQILNNYVGWETVTNPEAGTPGYLALSDAQKKNLRKNTVAANSMGSSQAIISALSLLPNVTSLRLLENVSSTTQTIEGVTMVSHSMYVCVAGDATNEEIGVALTGVKNIGCSYNNGPGIQESVVITDPYSTQPITVLFDRPSILTISVRVTIGTYQTVVDLVDNVKQAVVSYANGEMPNQDGFVVGANVSPFAISGAVMYFVQGVFVQKVEVATQSFTARGTIENGSITITGMTNVDGISSGQVITGLGIPDGTTVISVGSTTVQMSAAATLDATEDLTFTQFTSYSSDEIVLDVWQKAYTNAELVEVITA